MRRVVISLYDYTTLALNSWALHGYETHAFDALHEKEIKNEQGTYVHPWNADDHDAIEQVIRHAGERTLILGWPPCTDLTKVGNAHWKRKFEADPEFQTKALNKVLLVKRIAERIGARYMFENPVGRVSTLYRKPDYLFHPCYFGGYLPENDVHPLFPQHFPPRDAYHKYTCIWKSPDFVIPEEDYVCPNFDTYTSHNGKTYNESLLMTRVGGADLYARIVRSCTPRGFAQAVYEYNADF